MRGFNRDAPERRLLEMNATRPEITHRDRRRIRVAGFASAFGLLQSPSGEGVGLPLDILDNTIWAFSHLSAFSSRPSRSISDPGDIRIIDSREVAMDGSGRQMDCPASRMGRNCRGGRRTALMDRGRDRSPRCPWRDPSSRNGCAGCLDARTGLPPNSEVKHEARRLIKPRIHSVSSGLEVFAAPQSSSEGSPIRPVIACATLSA